MAENDDTTPQSPLGQAELTGLAQRLRARASSVLYRDQPRQAEDMRLAADAISELVRIRTELRRLADEFKDEDLEMTLRSLAGGAA